ncbi:MAG: redoxin domain-containing protein [Chloroflexi bacterium]|nr:redoxin domain-containing protein [Chloroflexota bacterium]
MKRQAFWALLLGIALLLLTLAVGCSSSSGLGTTGGQVKAQGAVEITPIPGAGAAPKVGRLAPDFTLPDLDGNSVSLSDFRGKVVLVNFWGTWCPPCRAEMPDILEIYQEYKGRGLEIIGVDAPPDTEEDVRTFITRGGFNWVFVMDKRWEVARLYSLGAFPTTFFIDEEGIIRQVRVGAMNTKELRERLSRLIK